MFFVRFQCRPFALSFDLFDSKQVRSLSFFCDRIPCVSNFVVCVMLLDASRSKFIIAHFLSMSVSRRKPIRTALGDVCVCEEHVD